MNIESLSRINKICTGYWQKIRCSISYMFKRKGSKKIYIKKKKKS